MRTIIQSKYIVYGFRTATMRLKSLYDEVRVHDTYINTINENREDG